jgi:hypothetical protein
MRRHHRTRYVNRSALAASALAAVLWLCLAGTASAAAPANDDFASAAPLSGLPANATGTVLDATWEAGEPSGYDHTVWWSWTAPSDGDVTVDTCGSGTGTRLGVYTGNSVEALIRVAHNLNACGSSFESGARLSFVAKSGQTYRIAVAEGHPYTYYSCSTSGSCDVALALKRSTKPANDDFADAAALPGIWFESVSVEPAISAGASREVGEPIHAGKAGTHSVWWRWTAPQSGVVRLRVYSCTSGSDVALAVYTGSAVGALSGVATDDGYCGLSFRAHAGVTYRIAVDSSDAWIGDFSLDIQGAPKNDDFENAIGLGGHSAENYGQNWFPGPSIATAEPGEPNHAGSAAGHSVWWRWTAPASGPVEIVTCGNLLIDSVLAVYTGDSVDDLGLVADNDDTAGCGPGSGVGSAVEFTAEAGTTYRIAVDGSSGAYEKGFTPIGFIKLTLRGPPAPPPATERFAIDGVKHNMRKGTATLTVEVPGPGEVALARTWRARSASAEAAEAGYVRLQVRPRGRAKRRLLGSGAIRVRANVTYAPYEGETDTRSMKLTLRLRR